MGVLPDVVWSQHQENPWVAFCHSLFPQLSGGQPRGVGGREAAPPHPNPPPRGGRENCPTDRLTPRRSHPVMADPPPAGYNSLPNPREVVMAEGAQGPAEQAPDTVAPTPAVDLTGRTFGDFLVLRRLGQGGMGQVFLA